MICFAQIIHATKIGITQLSESQIAPRGQIHNWEKNFTWMKTNLHGTTVILQSVVMRANVHRCYKSITLVV
jgi:hypothetical protein